MTGKASEDKTEQQIPRSLVRFATQEGLSVRDTITLRDVQERIVAARKRPKARMEKVDWNAFYDSIKNFL